MTKSIKKFFPVKGQPCEVIDFVKQCDQVGPYREPYLEPHRHEYWELVWCLDDTGEQQIDFIDYPNKRGRIFTIAPGQVHQSADMGNQVRLISFTPGFVETDYRSTQLVESTFGVHEDRLPYLDCSEIGIEYLSPIFKMLFDERQREDCDWSLVGSLVECFLRYVLRFSVSEVAKSDKKDARVSQLISLIEQHYQTHKKCQFYADELALTNKRLNEIVKAEKGKSVTQLIHDRLILEANRRLIFSTNNIKQIAFDLGFDDPAYFSRFYRSQMNETPIEFRLRCADSAT